MPSSDSAHLRRRARARVLRLPERRLPAVFRVCRRSWRRRFAFSSSFRRVTDRLRPARLMKNWIMRTPEPGPLGLTDRRAIVRAIVAASLVKRSFGGRVETVSTLALHFRVRWAIVLASGRCAAATGCWCIGHASVASRTEREPLLAPPKFVQWIR